MSKATIEGKVKKVVVNKDSCKNEVCLCIEVDENGIEKNTNTDKYYKPLLAKNGTGEIVSGCAQEVKKDEDYYYVEVCVPSKHFWLIYPLAIPSVIGKK